jgi:hypothetical protein
MGASTEVVSNPRLSRPASGESLTRHRARPRVGHRLTGCSTVAVKRGSTALPYLTFYLQNSTFWRADERTRTADLISLRVITQALQGCAGDCKFRISIGVSFLCLATCCTVLRFRWYQSGINIILTFAGHHRPPAASQIQSVEEGGPALPSIRYFDEGPVPSAVTACARWVPSSTSTSSRLTPPRPSECPLPSKQRCAFSPVGGGSRVFIVRWDYVETPLGTARPIT